MTEAAPEPSSPDWRAYLLATGVVGVAFGARLLLQPVLGTASPFLLFYPALLVASWMGGFGPGLWATILSVALADRFFIEPLSSWTVSSASARVTIVIFSIVGVSVAWLHDSLRRAHDHARRLADLAHQQAAAEEKAVAYLEIVRDELMCERKRLADLVADVPGVVWEAWGEPDAANQRINFVSEQVEKLLGYSTAEWLATPNFWLTIVHPDDRERAAREASTIFQSGVGGVSEFRWITKDGRVIAVEARTHTVIDETGRPIGMRGVTTDVTGRKRLEQERAALLVQAQTLNRVKDEFVATMSHELRTPLNAVLGWAQLLRAGRMPPEQAARGVAAIERNALALTRMVDELLDISRIITGKFRLELQFVDAAALVRAAVDSARPAAEAKGVALTCDVHPDMIPMRGDPHRLQQAIWNLLSNAVKFTPRSGQVQVRGRGADGRVEIVVQDTGEGIAADMLPYVFDRFRQADSTSARAFGGLGLGLAIVRHIVELHGGVVEAASAGPNQGATFTVSLPATTSVVRDRLPGRDAARGAASARPPAGGSRSPSPPAADRRPADPPAHN